MGGTEKLRGLIALKRTQGWEPRLCKGDLFSSCSGVLCFSFSPPSSPEFPHRDCSFPCSWLMSHTSRGKNGFAKAALTVLGSSVRLPRRGYIRAAPTAGAWGTTWGGDLPSLPPASQNEGFCLGIPSIHLQRALGHRLSPRQWEQPRWEGDFRALLLLLGSFWSPGSSLPDPNVWKLLTFGVLMQRTLGRGEKSKALLVPARPPPGSQPACKLWTCSLTLHNFSISLHQPSSSKASFCFQLSCSC